MLDHGDQVTVLVELEGRGFQRSDPITSGRKVGSQPGKLRAQGWVRMDVAEGQCLDSGGPEFRS